MKKYCPQILLTIGLILTTIGGIWSAMKINSNISDIKNYQTGQGSEVIISMKLKSILDLYNSIDNPPNQIKVFASIVGEDSVHNVLITGQQLGKAGVYSNELFVIEAEKIIPKSTVEIGSIVYQLEEKEKCCMKEYLPQILILFGMVLTAIGGVIAFIRMSNFRFKSITLSSENIKKTGENITLVEGNKRLTRNALDLTSQNQILINKNIELTDKTKNLATDIERISETIKKQTAEIYDYQTGGDSYLVITLNDFNSEKTQTLIVYATVIGDSPMYNLSIQYQETTKPGEPNNKLSHFKLNSIPPNRPTPLGAVAIPKNGKNGIYSFSIFSRNRNHSNMIFVSKEKTKYKAETKTYSDLKLTELLPNKKKAD